MRQARSFDQGPICVTAVEDLDRVADTAPAVCWIELLQHDRRRVDRRYAVVAVPAVAHIVAVDFVHDVKPSRRIQEAGRVDGASLIEVTLDSITNDGVWPLRGSRRRSAEAMLWAQKSDEASRKVILMNARRCSHLRLSRCFRRSST